MCDIRISGGFVVFDGVYDPGVLIAGTTYFWRIDEINSTGKTTGEVWTFTTATVFTPPPKGRACFTDDTCVWLDGIPVQISRAGLGQNVGCLNSTAIVGFLLPLPCPGKVEKVQEHEGTFMCYDVLLESGNCIKVAECHYLLAESERWVAVQNLKPASKLITAKGPIRIISITKRSTPYVGKVYNLQIEGSDWYLVGKDGVVVRDF